MSLRLSPEVILLILVRYLRRFYTLAGLRFVNASTRNTDKKGCPVFLAGVRGVFGWSICGSWAEKSSEKLSRCYSALSKREHHLLDLQVLDRCFTSTNCIVDCESLGGVDLELAAAALPAVPAT